MSVVSLRRRSGLTLCLYMAALAASAGIAQAAPLGAQQRLTDISEASGDDRGVFGASRPAVAYNSLADEYLVVYVADDSEFGSPDLGVEEFEVFGQRLSGDGDRIGGPARLSKMGPDGDVTFGALSSDVVYNSAANEYLVTWHGDDDTLPLVEGESEVFAQRVGANGAEAGPNDMRLSEMGTDGDPNIDASFPAVAYNAIAGEYLVTWQGDDTVDGENEIYGQRVSAAGAEVGANDLRLSDVGPDGSTAFSALNPSVAYLRAADEYLVAWHGDDNTPPSQSNDFEVRMQRVTPALAQTGPNDALLSQMGPVGSGALFRATSRSVAAGAGGQAMTIWFGDSNEPGLGDGETEIFGARTGPPVSTVLPSASGNAAVGGTLTCDPGSFTPEGTSIAFQWLRSGAALAGATGASYVVTEADRNATLACRVTADWVGGTGSALSNTVVPPASGERGAQGQQGAPGPQGEPALKLLLALAPGPKAARQGKRVV